MSQSKVEKTRARLAKRIQEGAYYEAHQQLRVLAQRYLKAENHEAAIDILFSGAQALLQAGQGGSGCDLCTMLVEVYVQGEVKVEPESKARIFTLMSLIPFEEPSRRKFIKEAVSWSAKFSPYPTGDPDLHHFIGSLYSLTSDFALAEPHLLCGTKSSADILASVLFDWYTASLNPPTQPTQPNQQPPPTDPAIYLARALLPYLLLRNLRDATRVYTLFTTSLSATHTNQEVQSSTCDAKVFTDLPLMNFLGLLLLACQRGGAELYRSLRSHYASSLKEVPMWEEPLEQIAELYFGIRIQRQTNLFDMMGSLFGGGGPGGAPQLGPPPPSAELD